MLYEITLYEICQRSRTHNCMQQQVAAEAANRRDFFTSAENDVSWLTYTYT